MSVESLRGTSHASLASKTYFDIWATEIRAKGWHQIFDTKCDKSYLYNAYTKGCVKVLDIATTGRSDEWSIDPPDEYRDVRDTLLQNWMRINQDRLRSDKTDVKVRIVVFNESTHTLMRELLGVTYDIEPQFFRDVAYSYASREDPGYTLPHDYRLLNIPRSSGPQHLNFGFGWNAKVISSPKGSVGPEKIVIISAASVTLSSPAAAIIDQNDQFEYTVPKIQDVYEFVGERELEVDAAEAYVTSILNSSQSFRELFLQDTLTIFLPILEFYKCRMYGDLADEDRWLRISQQKKNWRHLSHLAEGAWNKLRMMQHDGKAPFTCYRDYDTHQNQGKALAQPNIARLFQEFELVMTEIDRTEQLARDYFQAQVGWLSLEESRESIKQSRNSLAESKRTKLVTVLAFFFVPMSLGTSVFGMNINELNQSGQPLWVFIVTTVVIFAMSSVIWIISYLHHLYSSLPESSYWEQQYSHLDRFNTSTEDNVDWRIRLYLFLRLLQHGHIAWAWKSGIAISLYTSGRKGFIRSCTNHDDEISQKAQNYLDNHIRTYDPDDCHAPCAYIVQHLDLKYGFECSRLEYY